MHFSTKPFSANGIEYYPAPRPIVVVCMDGSADEYYNAALARDLLPHIKKMICAGFRGSVRDALPSFTNVNNASIVTGVAPDIHGICGNFFYDELKDEEVMMNSADYLRAETILSAAANAGRRVAVITAKEKLRDILSSNLHGIAFSAEKAGLAQSKSHGIEEVENLIGLKTPPIYSAEASLFVLRAGAVLIEKGIADFLYLSLTDYIQHSNGPDSQGALDFYQRLDQEFGRLLSLNALIGTVPDHGMNAKMNKDGKPNVLFIEDMLEDQFGSGFRVICPITDPYVKHHGALGSYVVVHISDKSLIENVKCWLQEQRGVTEVYTRQEAARVLEQPIDRIGDLILLSSRDTVLGRKPAFHDLSVLDGPLRSHGGRYEEMVSMIISSPLNQQYRLKADGDPRNFQIFDFTINGTN
ncbi:MAG TPA: phosphonoacetate hydrolase [Puia sp.]|nr:phosphonoacetate hydrolase [Puia sp.]